MQPETPNANAQTSLPDSKTASDGRPSRSAASAWEIRVLFDGACPLCSREIRLLEKLDRGRGRIQLEDISAADFDPTVYGLDARTVMDRIHGVLPDGTIVEGLAVFRRAYEAVGIGWLMAPTRWPGLRRLADRAYGAFARNRLRLTGRASTCKAGRCDAHPDHFASTMWPQSER
jgi:predicted DCC family thiol-disulfide oxidoreductase YuxK